jgi:hypothetical protein
MSKTTKILTAAVVLLAVDNVRIGLQNIALKKALDDTAREGLILAAKFKSLAGHIRVEDAEAAYVDLEFIDLTHRQ